MPATTTVVGLSARAARSGLLLLLEQQELSEVDGAVAVEVRDVEELLHALLVMVGVGVRVGVMVRVRDRVAGGVSKGDGSRSAQGSASAQRSVLRLRPERWARELITSRNSWKPMTPSRSMSYCTNMAAAERSSEGGS